MSSLPDQEWISEYQLPVTHEAILKGHERAVTTLSIDPGGARFVTGSNDYTVKFWDFGGMDERLIHFRSVEPSEGHQISQLAFSGAGDKFIVCPASAQPMLYDRDGYKISEFVKGDQMLMDMNGTKGHVAEVTATMWHPTDNDTILTASFDSTVRFWNIDRVGERHSSLVRARNARNLKVGITAAAIPPSSLDWIAAGCADGSIQIWPGKGLTPYTRAKLMVRGAHSSHQIDANTPPESPISCLKFQRGDPFTLVSRCCDGVVKVWDLRKFKTPMVTYEGLENLYQYANVTYSPGGKYLILGTSAPPNKPEDAKLVFIDAQSWDEKPIGALPFGSSVNTVSWHDRLNQLVVGCADATVRVFYSPTTSHHGALLCVTKAKPKAELAAADIGEGQVHVPNALPLYRDDLFVPKKRQRFKDSKDAAKSKIPARPPAVGRGSGGHLGSSDTSYLAKSMGNLEARRPTGRVDARENFLRHADVTDEFTQSFSAAYAKNQPKRMYDLSYLEAEEDGGGGAQY